MDILIQVIPAYKFENDTWSKCIRFVDTLIKEKNAFQKKAYKFITEIVSKVIHISYKFRFIIPTWKRFRC